MPTPVAQLAARVVLLILAQLVLVQGILSSVHRQPALRGGDKQILAGNSGPSCIALRNKGSYSLVDVAVGTPEQIFSIVADTGSDNVIIPSCMCQENHRCFTKDRCFRGTNKSSTFKMDDEPHGPSVLVIEFGSGLIQVAVSSDVVRVGNVQTVMDDGVYLMVDQQLNFGGSFEGILGLGIPSSMRPIPSPANEQEEEDELDFGLDVGMDGLDNINGLDDIIKEVMDGMSGAVPSVSGSGLVAKEINSHVGSLSDASVSDGEDLSGLISIIHAPSSNTSMDRKMKTADPDVLEQPGFLERAGVSRFSMCFNDGADGTLRLNPPPAARTLSNVGHHHWAVDFRGVSVGDNSTALNLCRSGDELSGDETPCAAIPDSGTTAIMGPREHIIMLFESLCDGWERCRQNHTAMVAAATVASEAAAGEYGIDPFQITPSSKSEIFQFLIFDCDSWLKESKYGLGELPSINFSLGGANGTKQVLQMPGWSYVVETLLDDFDSFQSRGREIIPMFSDVGARNASSTDKATDEAGPSSHRICEPAFESMDFLTANHGPIWIFGTPFFYMFDVGYDMETSPPGVSFTSIADSGCGTCATDSNAALISESQGASATRQRHRHPRYGGPKRRPSVDTSRPL